MAARARPVTQADKDRVKELHAQDVSRNDIAKAIGRSGRTVSRIAAELKLDFAHRGRTSAATAAKIEDGKARRAKLQVSALDRAQRLLDQMYEPATVYNIGGKDNVYTEKKVLEPPFRDKQAIAIAAKALADTALRLAEYDKATGNEDDKSMLIDLRDALITVRAQRRPPAEEQT